MSSVRSPDWVGKLIRVFDTAILSAHIGLGALVTSAEFDPVIVDVPLTELRVRELLAFGRESAKLDYKREFDPSKTRETLEITKDLVAMSNTAGGYVLIGVENNGTLVGLSEAEITKLDEAIIRGQVESYLGASLELFVDTPEFNGRRLGVITVLRSPRSPLVFQKDGQYSDPGGRPKTVFSQGDVFVRHGSRSERWKQEDVQAILARAVERERERWLASVLPDVRRLFSLAAGQAGGIPSPEPRELLNQDAEAFEHSLREILRRVG